MAEDLPYPGFSWQLTQHEIGLDADTVYFLLACASYHEGRYRPGHEISKLMIENNLLSPNLRDGKYDPWRDYQQILAELGLIYSTRAVHRITFTEAGKMYLAGSIGFSELMTIQSLRYQYPNGQKTQTSSRQQSALHDAGLAIPSSVMLLQSIHGVAIKPGLLILRILIELTKRNENTPLHVNEIRNFLLPTPKNIDWPRSLSNLLSARASDSADPGVFKHAQRNIRAWQRLLNTTDLFDIDEGYIWLSPYSIDRLQHLESYCDAEEQPDSFWMPKGNDRESKLDWFNYFGTIPFNSQKLMRPAPIDDRYRNKNYVGGLEEDDDEIIENPNLIGHEIPQINLGAVTTGAYGNGTINLTPEQALKGLRKGAIRRKIKSDLHDEIVSRLAQHFSSQGATVHEDRESVDLLVRWPDEGTAIFEVKTASVRNLQQRLRLSIGQLYEYSYRFQNQNGISPDKIAVFNMLIPKTAWQVPFLNRYLDIGLLCVSKDSSVAHNSYSGSTFSHWKNF